MAPLAFSVPSNAEVDSTDTAFVLVEPSSGNDIIVTDILVYANKDVHPTNDATISIYSADTEISTTIVDDLLTTEIPKQKNRDLTGLNLLVGEGLYISAKTNSSTIFVTIYCYYTPSVTA